MYSKRRSSIHAASRRLLWGESKGVRGRKVGLGAGGRNGCVLSPATLRPRLTRSVKVQITARGLRPFKARMTYSGVGGPIPTAATGLNLLPFFSTALT
jgi:hypothetical protein